MDDDLWIMIIRTDSIFKATIPSHLKHKILVFDAKNNRQFYSPVIQHAREVSTLQMLGEAWESTMSEAQIQEEEQLLDLPQKQLLESPKLRLLINKRFLDNYEEIYSKHVTKRIPQQE